jgi:hypothetical protein
MVHIRVLLTVDFYVYEVLIHIGSHFLALKAFPLHDMTPVAGRIADTDQHRFILLFSTGERLIAPGIPVYRIMRMLKQIRALFVDKSVGHSAKLANGSLTIAAVVHTNKKAGSTLRQNRL